jgi:hypothetical protein
MGMMPGQRLSVCPGIERESVDVCRVSRLAGRRLTLGAQIPNAYPIGHLLMTVGGLISRTRRCEHPGVALHLVVRPVDPPHKDGPRGDSPSGLTSYPQMGRRVTVDSRGWS